ncbi:MAG: polyprenyl synthetase family protein [Bacillota bacterium]|nr:polyprenyl synthetase family protein [Bacillota bacterium]
MKEDFLQVFKERAGTVETALDGFVKVKDNYQSKIYEAMRYSLLGGGKRLRGVLCICGARMAGGKQEEALPFACAIEMIHAYSLIHDDLPAMDNDDIRRGKPTCHKAFDEATAILAGDALLNGAFELIMNESRVSASNTLAAMKIIAGGAGTEGMIGGQVMDIDAEHTQIGSERLRQLHKLKTGALISAALMSGYSACGGDVKNEETLREYAEKIGLAFQVVDDILDVQGDEKTLGKPLKSDEKNGKSTFVTLNGVEKSKMLARTLSGEAASLVKDMGEEGAFLAWLAEYLSDRKF